MGLIEELKQKIQLKKSILNITKQVKRNKNIKNTYREQLKHLYDYGLIDGVNTIDDVNAQLLTIAQTDNTILDQISLTPQQANDLDFMMTLYKCGNRNFSTDHIPTTNDINYLIEYLKVINIKNSSSSNIGDVNNTYGLIECLKYLNPKTYANVDFVEALIQNFPNENVLDALKVRLTHIHTMPRIAGLKLFHDLMQQLSTKSLKSQARHFGIEATQHIPYARKDYVQLVSSSIECDDFASLGLLSPQQLVDHKDYINKAFEYAKTNKTLTYLKVKTFFNSILSPIRLQEEGSQYPNFYFSKPHLLASYNIARDKELWDSIDIPDSMKQTILLGLEKHLQHYALPDTPTDKVEDDNTKTTEELIN